MRCDHKTCGGIETDFLLFPHYVITVSFAFSAYTFNLQLKWISAEQQWRSELRAPIPQLLPLTETRSKECSVEPQRIGECKSELEMHYTKMLHMHSVIGINPMSNSSKDNYSEKWSFWSSVKWFLKKTDKYLLINYWVVRSWGGQLQNTIKQIITDGFCICVVALKKIRI